MKQPSEFGGILEIVAIAYLTETQIYIHELGTESRYRLTACIPFPSESDGLPQIHLLCEVDTRDQPGHFDLLADRQKSPVIDKSTRESGARLTFIEMVKIFCGCSFQDLRNVESAKSSDEGDIETNCDEETKKTQANISKFFQRQDQDAVPVCPVSKEVHDDSEVPPVSDAALRGLLWEAIDGKLTELRQRAEKASKKLH